MNFNNYGKEMLMAVPVSWHNSTVSCGLGVFIQRDTPLGLTYGHSGWIPGYRSSVQYYPEHYFSVAFQINTYFGFDGDPIEIFDEIKWRLAASLPAYRAANQ